MYYKISNTGGDTLLNSKHEVLQPQIEKKRVNRRHRAYTQYKRKGSRVVLAHFLVRADKITSYLLNLPTTSDIIAYTHVPLSFLENPLGFDVF